MTTYNTSPMGIENESMRIIGSEMKPHNFDEKTLKIVKRVIHTTADFEYADLLEFHPDAINSGIEALRQGCDIYADTQMVMSGISSRTLKKLGSKVYNNVHDDDVYKRAKEEGITRSMAAIEKTKNDKNTKIFAIGNAPTAIFKLIEMIKDKKIKPDLIVGVPVGFVGAAESKEALKELDIPYIVVNGRKGGSPVAATIINAIMYQIER